MTAFTLYQRDECHLCDRALEILAQAGVPDFESVWVGDVVTLASRYSTRVPVLHDQRDGRELDWPFDAVAVKAFIASAPAERWSRGPDLPGSA